MARTVKDKSSLAFDDELAGEIDYDAEENSVNYGDYVLAEPAESLEAVRDYYNYYILRSPKQSEAIRDLTITSESTVQDVI